MKVEILFFDGCPNHAAAVELVDRALRREGIPGAGQCSRGA
jgi:hypothetical protein